jgi:acetoin utilization protein AcuC
MSPIPNFFYSERMEAYDFGPRHPLKPERLRRTLALLRASAPGLQVIEPGLAAEEDLLAVHDEELIEAVAKASAGLVLDPDLARRHGLVPPDVPPFEGMHEASLSYCGGAIRAAEAVRDGAPLAFNIAGGLHHARRGESSGFCVYNDCALAIAVLRERFTRVAYLDIDVHHGDGVQWIWYEMPDVLTISIHQDGRTLYPGSGGVDEEGAEMSSINIPLPPFTGGEAWLHALREVVPAAIDRFRPEALVLQMGADAHRLDPLARFQLRAQDWLEGVRLAGSFGLPTVALGGGGYDLTTVPRMWTAAVLALSDMEIPSTIPSEIPAEWGMTAFEDAEPAAGIGMDQARVLADYWRGRIASASTA